MIRYELATLERQTDPLKHWWKSASRRYLERPVGRSVTGREGLEQRRAELAEQAHKIGEDVQAMAEGAVAVPAGARVRWLGDVGNYLADVRRACDATVKQTIEAQRAAKQRLERAMIDGEKVLRRAGLNVRTPGADLKMAIRTVCENLPDAATALGELKSLTGRQIILSGAVRELENLRRQVLFQRSTMLREL